MNKSVKENETNSFMQEYEKVRQRAVRASGRMPSGYEDFIQQISSSSCQKYERIVKDEKGIDERLFTTILTNYNINYIKHKVDDTVQAGGDPPIYIYSS